MLEEATVNVRDRLQIAGLSTDGSVASGLFVDTQSEGYAGNLVVNAGQVELRERGQITASSEFGLQGTVVVNTPDADPSRGTVELPVEFSIPPLVRGCAVGSQDSRFVYRGAGKHLQDKFRFEGWAVLTTMICHCCNPP